MTVADIITAARTYAQITTAAFFSAADELRSVNRAWRDVYERILQSDDEFFITAATLSPSAFTAVRSGVWDASLPADFYRLRRLAGVLGDSEVLLARKDPLDEHRAEGYRFFGQGLRLFYLSGYSSFRLEYYPKPAEYTSTAADIVYPPQLEPLIIAYQMAMDIAKQSGADPAKHAEEYARLWDRFERAASNRDNLRHKRVANVYRSTFPGY